MNKLKLFGWELKDCPPTDVESPSGIVYCFVWNNPPQKQDFRTARERKPGVYNKLSDDEKCEANGFSVFTNYQDILVAKEDYRGFRKAYIAEANLTSECGVIKNTPSGYPSHHTWWPPIEKQIWLLFKIETQ
ncbi:MAG: hypothetical protein OXI43_05260 [Candidatus Poribacteria bacterium]|nr:hypothetical protein [Candidatus Poribacteria bacterium]